MKKITFRENELVVMQTKYMDNDNLALILITEEDLENGGSYEAIITVNTDQTLPNDCAYVKDYSENSGMLEAIQKGGLVDEVLGSKPSGFVELPLVKFNLEGVESVEL